MCIQYVYAQVICLSVSSMFVLRYGYQGMVGILKVYFYLFFHIALSHLMQDKYGETSLIVASQEGHLKCATILLKHRADVNYQRKVRLLYVHGGHG